MDPWVGQSLNGLSLSLHSTFCLYLLLWAFCIQKMWYIYIIEYYSAIKINEFTKFLSKWMELEIIPSEVTQSQKNTHDMHLLVRGY